MLFTHEFFTNFFPDKRLKVGIYGYGRFGSFLANKMANHNFNVFVTDFNYDNIKNNVSINYSKESIKFLVEEEFFTTKLDIVIFANSINSFEEVIKKIDPNFFTDKLIVDVNIEIIEPEWFENYNQIKIEKILSL
jgi:prephenate dehydrogenase